MTAPATNALSYNAYVTQIGVLAVVTTQETAGVVVGVDDAFNDIIPQMLNYAELRIQRDLDFLSSQSSNQYTLNAGVNVFPIPVNDFFIVNTLEIVQLSNGAVVNTTPLLETSKEYIQNVYGGLLNAGQPAYYAKYGDAFGGNQDTQTNILLGPTPSYGFSLQVTGVARMPSLYLNAVAGIADTGYTYISQFLPDMLLMASMIYITMFQRNFGPVADTPESGMTYEKQYQALRLGAIAEENRRKGQASAWSSYSTPTAATPTR